MTLLRDLLLLALVACALTMLASAAAWWGEAPRRLRRALRRMLSGRIDAQLICWGRGLAMDLHGRRVAVAWERGGGRVHDLDRLTGMELLVDGHVAARAFRGAEGRALDQIDRQAREVVLRLVFDDAHDPDFQIWLWRAGAAAEPNASSAAIDEARRWIARADAIMRQTTRPETQRPETQRPETQRPAVSAPPPAQGDDGDETDPW